MYFPNETSGGFAFIGHWRYDRQVYVLELD